MNAAQRSAARGPDPPRRRASRRSPTSCPSLARRPGRGRRPAAIAGQMRRSWPPTSSTPSASSPLIEQALDEHDITGQPIAHEPFLPDIGWLDAAFVAQAADRARRRARDQRPIRPRHPRPRAARRRRSATTDPRSPASTNRVPAGAEPGVQRHVRQPGRERRVRRQRQDRASAAARAKPITVAEDASTRPRTAAPRSTVQIPLGTAPPIGTPVTVTVQIVRCPARRRPTTTRRPTRSSSAADRVGLPSRTWTLTRPRASSPLAGCAVALVALAVSALAGVQLRRLRAAQRVVLGEHGERDLVAHAAASRARLPRAARLRRGRRRAGSTAGWARPRSASTARSPTAAWCATTPTTRCPGRQSTSIALLDTPAQRRRAVLDPPPRPGAAVRQADPRGRGRARSSRPRRPRRSARRWRG